MDTSKIRKDSFEAYKLYWKQAVVVCAIYMGITFVASLLSNSVGGIIGGLLMIAFYVIMIPLAYGLNVAMWKIFNKETVGPIDFVTIGFANFKRAWGITLRTILKILIPVILVVVGAILIAIGGAGLGTLLFFSAYRFPWWAIILMIIGGGLALAGEIWGIIAGLHYVLAVVIAVDNESADPKSCVEKSKELMLTRRGKYFVSMLPSIGFFFLVSIASSLFFWNATLLSLAQYAGYAFILPLMLFVSFIFYNEVKNSPVEIKEVVKEQPKEVTSEPVQTVASEQVNEPIQQPVVEQVSEPVQQPVAEQVSEPVQEPVTEQVSEPVQQPVVEQVSEPVQQPVVEQPQQVAEEPKPQRPMIL